MEQIDKEIQEKQIILDKVQFFLSRTTEPFNDWEWDEESLSIYLNGEKIEEYSRADLLAII